MSEIKTYQKNDFLFKENEKITHLYFIQSGKINLGWMKNNKFIELSSNPVVPTVLGEQALTGAQTHTFSALATQETKVLQVPIDQMKNQLESLPQTFKMIIKFMIERQKILVADTKNYKWENQQVPMPEDKVAKCFMSLYVAAKSKGEQDQDKSGRSYLTVNWPNLKLYMHKVFDEPPKRAEHALMILKKIGLVETLMGHPPEDPEGPEMLLEAKFYQLDYLEWFVEFYQHYFFKPEKSHVVRYEEFVYKLVEAAVHLGRSATASRGLVRISLDALNEKLKQTLNTQLNPDHQIRLEGKGIFYKRIPGNPDSQLEFELAEWEKTILAWRITHEIDKLNLKGFVDFQETTSSKEAESASGFSCPQCASKLEKAHKFCPECGFKLAA